MAFDPKNFRRRALAGFTLALSATLAMSALAACATTTEETAEDEEETVTSQTDTQKILNGNFEFYSEMDEEDRKEKLDLISSPDSWSFTSGSPSSVSASGIIDTQEWSYLTTSGRELTSVDDAVANWNSDTVTAYDRLKFYEDFEDEIDDLDSDSEAAELFADYTYSIDYEDVRYLSEIGSAPTPRTGAAEGETSVLMIHDHRTSDGVVGTAQYYTSSTTVTLDAGTAAKVSVWVRTNDLTHYYAPDENEDPIAVEGNAGAYIRVNQTVGSTTLDPVYIENINTQGEWKEYTVYVHANSFTSTSFTIVLGLGQGSSDNRLHYVNGFAFFDDVTCELLSSAAYGEAEQGSGTNAFLCSVKDEDDAKRCEGNTYTAAFIDLDVDMNGDDLTFAADPVSITADPDGGKSNVVYNGTYSDDYAKVTTIEQLLRDAAGNSYLSNICNNDFKGGNAFLFDGASNAKNIVMLMSVSSAPYTAVSQSYDLGKGEHMIVSFRVKTSEIGGTGASATLVDGENRTQIAAFDSTTVATVDIDDDNEDIYNGWVQCFFFVSNKTDSTKSFRLEFSYGPTDVASAEQTAYDDGYAAFTDFNVFTNVDAKLMNYASSGTYTQIVSLTGDVDNDSAFDAPGVNSDRDIRTTLAMPANFTGAPNASKSIVTGGVENAAPESYELYAGLLNASYAEAYRTGTAQWAKALGAIATTNNATLSDSLSENEAWWAKIFGDYDIAQGAYTRATSRVANQPLVVLNTSTKAVNSYGFLSETFSVSASSYQRVSMRVKLSEGATATIYLIDTSDVKAGYNSTLTPTLPSVTFWYDDSGNITKGDPSADGYNTRTGVAFYLESNGLYTKAGANDGVYYANLQNYTEDDVTHDLIAEDASGNTTIAFYYNDGKYYAYREEVSRGTYTYSQEVKDIYTSLSDGEKVCVRYDYSQLETEDKYESKITVTGTAETAGKWVDVSFYIRTGVTAKNYRLEVWAGSRDFDVAENGTVTPTGTKIPAGAYLFFDDYTSTDVSENYEGILSEAEEELRENSANLADPADPSSNLNSDIALYYTYTFYDAGDYRRYDETLDEDSLGNPYGSYTQSSYSEALAWLRYETAESTALFLDYAATDVTVEADDLSDDDDTATDDDGDAASDTNIWLIVSSGVLAFALVFAIVAIIVRRVHKKLGKRTKIKPAKEARVKPVKKEEAAPAPKQEPPVDENDPYNE